jgi:hypothetical protein
VTSYSSQGLTADRCTTIGLRRPVAGAARRAHLHGRPGSIAGGAQSRRLEDDRAHRRRGAAVVGAARPPAPRPGVARIPVDAQPHRGTQSATAASFGGPRTGPAPSASAPRHTRDQGTAHAATPEAAPRGAARTPEPATGDGHGQGR